MLYLVAAGAVLLLHLGFIASVLFGALLVARRPWVAALHLPALAWGLYIEISGGICPLTPAENFFRRQAGQSGYTESFVEHYLLALIYPDGLTPSMQLVLAAVVAVLNAVLYGRAWQVRRRGRS